MNGCRAALNPHLKQDVHCLSTYLCKHCVPFNPHRDPSGRYIKHLHLKMRKLSMKIPANLPKVS